MTGPPPSGMTGPPHGGMTGPPPSGMTGPTPSGMTGPPSSMTAPVSQRYSHDGTTTNTSNIQYPGQPSPYPGPGGGAGLVMVSTCYKILVCHELVYIHVWYCVPVSFQGQTCATFLTSNQPFISVDHVHVSVIIVYYVCVFPYSKISYNFPSYNQSIC